MSGLAWLCLGCSFYDWLGVAWLGGAPSIAGLGLACLCFPFLEKAIIQCCFLFCFILSDNVCESVLLSWNALDLLLQNLIQLFIFSDIE